ncbi:Cell wall-associated polypeptide CWBP200 [Neisseria zoodegmatis]|uniref:Cell wall-associated polypeptide CWBP200 n=1 Tax=Neisseria zoodegmatis TaxID=326523 RepID=A0AB38DS84_9NEIS|nr:Cell wall-associated polypeptide CWBP200 [Neisseria zoodegmatis]
MDYAYDKLGRIESAVNKQSGHSEKFAFDPAHNILSDKVSDGLKDKGLSEHLSDRHHISRTKGRNIGKGNRLEAYNGTEYTYDALGNMIYRQLPDGESQWFQYDSENQLIRAEIKKPKGNTEIWEYAYDPFGRRLSKERKDKLAWTSTAPKRTHFVWDGTRLLQEYTYKGSYTYVYTDQDSYEPLAQIFDNAKDGRQYLSYFHNDQIGIPREMTDQYGNLLWYGSYSAWGSLASEKRIYENIHQPFRLQNQYCDEETGLHYNFFRYYEPDTGRFVNQDPIGLWGGDNFYSFAPNIQNWIDVLGLKSIFEKFKITTSDGFLFRGFTIRAPFNIPVQRFGVLHLHSGRGDFWGLRIGTNSFINRTFAAILPSWNPLTNYNSGVIPKGTKIKFGIIGPQGLRYPGGSLQFIVHSEEVKNVKSRQINRKKRGKC